MPDLTPEALDTIEAEDPRNHSFNCAAIDIDDPRSRFILGKCDCAVVELRRLRTENEEAIQQRDKMVTRALALQAKIDAALAICDRRGDDTRMRAALTGEATE